MRRVVKLNEFFSVSDDVEQLFRPLFNFLKHLTPSSTMLERQRVSVIKKVSRQGQFLDGSSYDVFTEADVHIQNTVVYNLK